MPTGPENQRFRRERIKAAGGKHTKEEVALIRAAQGDKCLYCNISLEDRGHVDHIIPICQGGSNEKGNIQVLCVTCNCIKGSRVLGELYERITLGTEIWNYMPYTYRAYWLDAYKTSYKKYATERRKCRISVSYWGDVDKYNNKKKALKKLTIINKDSMYCDIYVVLHASTEEEWIVSDNGDKYNSARVSKTACKLRLVSQPDVNGEADAVLCRLPKWLAGRFK